MSVSLTRVQAALQNHLTSSGSGPLTLNVLHKTDALVQQLQALNQGKPLNIEVLKSLPNGRAEVLTNGLKLDVKASLPLTKGEVLQLKLEQHGNALRFVQPLGDGATASKAPSTTGQPVGQQQGALQQSGKALSQNAAQLTGAQNSSSLNSAPLNSSSLNSVGQQLSGQVSGQKGAPIAQQTATLQPSSGSLTKGGVTPSPQNGQPINGQPPNSGLQSGSALNSGGAFNTNTQGATLSQTQTNLQPHSQSQTQLQAQQQAVAAQTARPGQAQAQITASALIGVVADTLPSLAKKINNRAQTHSQLQGHEKAAGRIGAQGTSSLGGANISQNQQLAQDVTAKYKNTSSLAIEEVQEMQQRVQPKPMELSLELPIQGIEKPVLVDLQIGPEQEESDSGDQRDGHGVKFSLETEDTGPVHASVGLFGKDVRISLWAEHAEFAALLEQYRETLDDRLEANGLGVASLHIRRGSPPDFFAHSKEHVDAQI